MLNVKIHAPDETDSIAQIFHRDGFAVVKDVLSPQQFEALRGGALRVIDEQTRAIKLENANRGFARYSFGDQMHQTEWSMLVDLPPVINALQQIWKSEDFLCVGGGGDYSLPGAKIQALHADMGDFFNDPSGQVTFHDVPAPFIVVNFLMVDFTVENGAIRFVPCTQRSRAPVPSLEHEPEWMRQSHLCAPAGVAVIRDVRCWHGGTANLSNQIRPMTSVGFSAPWFRMTGLGRMPQELYRKLSARGQKLCAGLGAG